MSEFQRIMSTSELPPPGEAREVACGDVMLCIANCNGAISAMNNVCPHRYGPLGQGTIEDGKLICPWHAWAFDVKTGVAVHTAKAKAEVYGIKIEGDDVLVKL